VKWRWAVAAIAALTIGATCAEVYARLAVPYYSAIATLIAKSHPWKIVSVDVVRQKESAGTILRLIGEVRRSPADLKRAALVTARVHVGAAVETPLVFWALLLAWPVNYLQQRLVLVAVGIPMFIGLEIATTVCQLLTPLAWASAVLGGNPDPITLWDRWSRFLEAGGRFVLLVVAALLAIAVVRGMQTNRHTRGG
jgi:hypothetical protein